jgi:hypothetical protein
VTELARMSEQELLERHPELNSDQAHKLLETARAFENAASTYRYDQRVVETAAMGTGFITAELMTAICAQLGLNRVESLVTVLTSMHVVSTGTSMLLSNPNLTLSELLEGTMSPTSLARMIRGLGPATLYIEGFDEVMGLVTGQEWGDSIGERALSFWVGGSLMPKIAKSIGGRVFAAVAERVARGTLAKAWLRALTLVGNAVDIAGWVLFALQAKDMAKDLALFMASNDPNFQSNMRDGWALNIYQHRNDADAANYWAMPDISDTATAERLIDLVGAASGNEIIEAHLYVDNQIEDAGAGAREQLMAILQMKMFDFARQILSQNPDITLTELYNQVGLKMQEYMASIGEPVIFTETEQVFVGRIEAGLAEGKSPEAIVQELVTYQQTGAYQYSNGIPGLAPAPVLSENDLSALLDKVLINRCQQLWQQISTLKPLFGRNAAFQNHDLFYPDTGAQVPLTSEFGASLYEVFMSETGWGVIQNLHTEISRQRMQTLLALATYQNGEWVLPNEPIQVTEAGQILPSGSLLVDNGDGTFITYADSGPVTVYQITVGDQEDIDLGLAIRKEDGTLVINQDHPEYSAIMGSLADRFLITPTS